MEQPLILESHEQDTGTLQPNMPDHDDHLQNDQEELTTIPEEDEEIDPADQDTLVLDSDE